MTGRRAARQVLGQEGGRSVDAGRWWWAAACPGGGVLARVAAWGGKPGACWAGCLPISWVACLVSVAVCVDAAAGVRCGHASVSRGCLCTVSSDRRSSPPARLLLPQGGAPIPLRDGSLQVSRPLACSASACKNSAFEAMPLLCFARMVGSRTCSRSPAGLPTQTCNPDPCCLGCPFVTAGTAGAST